MPADGVRVMLLATIMLAAALSSGCVTSPTGDDSGDPVPDPRGDRPTGDSGDPVADPRGDEMEVFAPGWPALSEASVRPGVRIAPEIFSGDCTANFVFSTPDNRTLYLGAASHCVTGLSVGDPVDIAGGAVTGTLVYCSWGTIDGDDVCPNKTANDDGYANDFALVEIPDGARPFVHPAILHWGGPTGYADGPPDPDTHALTYGNTPLRDADQEGPGSDAADAREGFTTHSTEWLTYVRFAPLSIIGDSGSAVILADGTVLGIMIAIGLFEGANAVTQLNPALTYLHNNTELNVELKTWHMLEDPILSSYPLSEVASAR